jgi:hypothetical protein
VQDGTIAANTVVNLSSVWVTAITDSGFFAQEQPGGQFSGVFVFVEEDGPDITGLAIGDLVDIEGVALEFNAITEVDATNGAVTEVGTLDPTPELDVVTMAELAADVGEPWEGVLIRVENDPITVVGLAGGGEFIVNDGSGDGYVDDYLFNVVQNGQAEFPDFSNGATFTAIQGPINFTTGNYKIAPRSAADLEGYMPTANPTLDINDLLPGDLVITEIMYDPNVCSDNNCEWFEVYNASGAAVDLIGLRVQDNNLNLTGDIEVSLVVEPNAYVWLGRGPMANWTYSDPADAYYGPEPAWNNGNDRVVILNDNEIIDQSFTYSDTLAAGISWQLDPGSVDAMANDSASNWCASTVVFDQGDRGSPREPNHPCN